MSLRRRRTAEDHFGLPEVVRRYASMDHLFPPEEALLDLWRPRLSQARFLDLGVGGGRTTVHFGDRVATYVGVDFAPAMVEACRDRFHDRLGPDFSFVVADARDLEGFEPDSFDFVLFSYQGMDSMTDELERQRTLESIHRVLTPGGGFAFSSSNLANFRDSLSLRRAVRIALRPGDGIPGVFAPLRRPRKTLQALAPPVRLWASRLWRDLGYFGNPADEVNRLRSHGFGDVRVLSPKGADVTEADPQVLRQYPWFYYVCEKAAAA